MTSAKRNVQDEIEAHEFGLTTATCAKSNVKVAYVDVVPFLVVSTGKYGHRVHWLYHTKRSGQQKRANLREAGNVCAKTFLILCLRVCHFAVKILWSLRNW